MSDIMDEYSDVCAERDRLKAELVKTDAEAWRLAEGLSEDRDLWKSKAESFERAALTYREGLVKAQEMLKASHREDSSLQAKAEKLAEALRRFNLVGHDECGDAEPKCPQKEAKAALSEFGEGE